MPTVIDRESVHVTRDQSEAARRALPTRAGQDAPRFGLSQGDSFVELPAELQPLLRRIVESVAEGRRVTVGELPEEVTTTLAAEMLEISRPTLMKRVRAGEIPAHKVGSHTRLRTADVLAAQTRTQQQRREAFDELRRAQDDGGLAD